VENSSKNLKKISGIENLKLDFENLNFKILTSLPRLEFVKASFQSSKIKFCYIFLFFFMNDEQTSARCAFDEC
jgi:hypothetical protein